MWITFRIPQAVVHPVENPLKKGISAFKNTFHAHTILGCLDLLCILGTDRGDGLGINDSRLEKAHLTPELQSFRVKETGFWQPCHVQLLFRKDSLVSYIMDRENGRRTLSQ